MKVREVIEQLQQADADAELSVISGGYHPVVVSEVMAVDQWSDGVVLRCRPVKVDPPPRGEEDDR